MARRIWSGKYKEISVKIPIEIIDDFNDLSPKFCSSDEEFVCHAVTAFVLEWSRKLSLKHCDDMDY